MAQKQHYISKILTKPWEHVGPPKRSLYYFDFDKNEILNSSSRDLLSKDDLWSEEYELIFNKIETRLPGDIEKLLLGPSKLAENISSETIRALITLHYFNAMRSMNARWKLDDSNWFVNLSEKERQVEIELFAKDIVFIGLPLSHGFSYFFPETGFFRIPLFNHDSDETNFAFAIPLNLQFAFGMFPKEFCRLRFKEMMKSKSILVELSIGLNSDNKVILPSHFVQKSNINDFVAAIKTSRISNMNDYSYVMLNSEQLRKRSEATINHKIKFS